MSGGDKPEEIDTGKGKREQKQNNSYLPEGRREGAKLLFVNSNLLFSFFSEPIHTLHHLVLHQYPFFLVAKTSRLRNDVEIPLSQNPEFCLTMAMCLNCCIDSCL